MVKDDHGFTRFRWQVLNSLYEAGSTTRSDIFKTMKTFIDARRLAEILDGFVQQGCLSGLSGAPVATLIGPLVSLLVAGAGGRGAKLSVLDLGCRTGKLLRRAGFD